jgi:hypothetical protein
MEGSFGALTIARPVYRASTLEKRPRRDPDGRPCFGQITVL